MRAFLFPGQGSQVVGMGKALCDAFAESREVFQRADEALGFGLSRLCFEGPESDLQLTANTQPAILTTSIAALAAVRKHAGLEADVAAGHSLGEWSALVAAGALSFEDAVRLVRLRGQSMQEAVPAGTGGMAAVIGLDPDAVRAVCAEAAQGQGQTETCAPANFNGAGQIVIAGSKSAVERAMVLAKERKAKLVKALPVSAPFHCALMAPAADKVRAALEAVSVGPLAFPVVTNVEARDNRDAGRVKDLLVRQVTAPVRWEESVRHLAELGVTEAIEVGAGNVLQGLVKRIAPSIALKGAGDPASVEALSRQTTGEGKAQA
jgi:[acyl-carrier-protein] S-malonyltransferase